MLDLGIAADLLGVRGEATYSQKITDSFSVFGQAGAGFKSASPFAEIKAGLKMRF